MHPPSPNEFLRHPSQNRSKSTVNIRYRKINRRPKRISKKNVNEQMKILSCNASNLNSKLYSLENVVNSLNLSLFCLQETFMAKEGNIRFKNSDYYHIFEQVRVNKKGGGLAIGALKTLQPKWIKQGNEPIEALTIQIYVQKIGG